MHLRADLAKLLDEVDRGGFVLDQTALGQFHIDKTGVESRLGKRFGEMPDHGRVHQLPCRHIDRNAQVVTVGFPFGGLFGGRLHDPAAEHADQT